MFPLYLRSIAMGKYLLVLALALFVPGCAGVFVCEHECSQLQWHKGYCAEKQVVIPYWVPGHFGTQPR